MVKNHRIVQIFSLGLVVVILLGCPEIFVPTLEAKEVLPFSRSKLSTALVSIQTIHPFDPGNSLQTEEDRILALFQTSRRAKPRGYMRDGSGIIIHPRGILVTNYHIVRGASGIVVTLFNGIQTSGCVVHTVPASDLAFIAITPPCRLDYVPLENSDRIPVGAKVYFAGHALSHKGSIYGGEISSIFVHPSSNALRTVLFQVNFGFHLFSGDSGSPLLDQKGYLIGLISAGRRRGDKAVLAIASNQIRDAYRNMPIHVITHHLL